MVLTEAAWIQYLERMHQTSGLGLSNMGLWQAVAYQNRRSKSTHACRESCFCMGISMDSCKTVGATVARMNSKPRLPKPQTDL